MIRILSPHTRIELRRLLKLAVPVMITQVGIMLHGVVDNIMVGHVSVNALAGVTVAGSRVLVADKDALGETDVYHCLHADSGEALWSVRYPAAGEMDFTNAPRAAPVVKDDLVYLLELLGRGLGTDEALTRVYGDDYATLSRHWSQHVLRESRR